MQTGPKLSKRVMARMVNGLEILWVVAIRMYDDNFYLPDFLWHDVDDEIGSGI